MHIYKKKNKETNKQTNWRIKKIIIPSCLVFDVELKCIFSFLFAFHTWNKQKIPLTLFSSPPPPPPSFVNWLEIQIRCLGDRPLELAKCGERNRCPRGATLLRHKNSGICHPSRPAPRGYKALIHTHVAFTANSPDLAFVESGRVGWVRYGGEGGLKRRNSAAAPPPVSRNP